MQFKNIVFFRHAQKLNWSNDPDLSPQGHEQALQLAEWVRDQRLPHPQKLLSSPKKRAQQTFFPLQAETQSPLLIHPGLDERLSQETGKLFEARVRLFLEKTIYEFHEECLFAVTHMDWIEVLRWMAPLASGMSLNDHHIPPTQFYHLKVPQDPSQPWTLIKEGVIK